MGIKMTLKTRIVTVSEENLAEHPQAICFINPKHPLFDKKVGWLKQQFSNGLTIKLLYLEGEMKPVGFIEYVPGEHCWRAADAAGYLFIHCLWINGKKYQRQGLGGLLIDEAEKDAEGSSGVAAVTSDKSFMANKEIFLKRGYRIVAESGKDQLLARQLADAPPPSINDWQSELAKHQGLTIVYSKQCPWVARFVEEVKPILKKEKLAPEIIELTSARQAQKAPSLYGIFNLIYEGRLLADRYISATRFMNIIKKDIKPKA